MAVSAALTAPMAGLRSAEPESPAKAFRAGAACSNISPPLDEPLVGGWSSPLATHQHDELWARCLVLDNGQQRVALVILDSIGVSRDTCAAARAKILEKTGIAADHVLIAATHTHSSINARGSGSLASGESLNDYQSFLVRRIADGVRRAVNQLEPARIAWGGAAEPTSVFNRRYYMQPGTPTPNPFGGQDQVVMNPGQGRPEILKEAGPTDPEVAFLAVQSVEGRPIALLANYSLHYVGPGAGNVVSADYFGAFADRIEQLLDADHLDPPFVGILTNGTSADINNIDWLHKPDKRWPPYAKMKDVADRVAQAVWGAYRDVQYCDWVELGAVAEDLTLSVRKPTLEQLERARAVLDEAKKVETYHVHEPIYARRMLQLAEGPDRLDVTLQAIRIGDVGICAIPFEVFVEIGLQLKAESPLPRLFTISHANGAYGYLPTVEQHALGGYETWLGTNKVEIEAAPKIVRQLQAMLARLAGGQAAAVE